MTDDFTTGGDVSPGGEDQLSGGRAQDHHEENRENDGGDRTHPSSLADGTTPPHSAPGSRHGLPGEGRSSTRIGENSGEAHRRATYAVDQWLSQLEQNEPAVLAIEKNGNRRFVRLQGEEKSVFTVWLLIGQHTLHHETFMMPAPIENHAEFYAHLLRRNHSLRGVAFTIGAEDAIFLEGRTPLEGLDFEVLDEVIGTHFEAVERYYRPAMRIGWRSLFRG